MGEILQMPQGPTSGQEEQLKRIKAQLMSLAARMWELMPPGGDLVFEIPLRGQIITPGQPAQFGILSVTKPLLFEVIQGKQVT